jgi:hypothetical protein
MRKGFVLRDFKARLELACVLAHWLASALAHVHPDHGQSKAVDVDVAFRVQKETAAY